MLRAMFIGAMMLACYSASRRINFISFREPAFLPILRHASSSILIASRCAKRRHFYETDAIYCCRYAMLLRHFFDFIILITRLTRLSGRARLMRTRHTHASPSRRRSAYIPAITQFSRLCIRAYASNTPDDTSSPTLFICSIARGLPGTTPAAFCAAAYRRLHLIFAAASCSRLRHLHFIDALTE